MGTQGGTISELAQNVPALAVNAGLLKTLIADAYHEAAITGLSMRRVMEHLEDLRTAAATAGDCFALLNVLDDQVALAMSDLPLAKVVRNLRREYSADLLGAVTAELDGSTDDARTDRYAAALAASLTYWRRWLVVAILDRTSPGLRGDPVLSRAGEWRHYVEQDQGAYLSPLLQRLASFASVDRKTRVRLLVLAAQIETYQFEETGSARQLLAQAAELSPQEPSVISAQGELWLQLNDSEQAERAFSRALELDGRFAPAHVGYGDFFARQSMLPAAEEQYHNAIRAQPGDVGAYRSLIELYGRPDMFPEHFEELQVLVERAVFIDPDSAAEINAAAGTSCQQNSRYLEARAFFAQAVAAAPQSATPHQVLSRLFAEQQDYVAAEDELRQALAIAPRLANLHCELGIAYEQQGRLEDALAAYQRAVNEPSPWVAAFASLAAEAKWRLGDREGASEDLLRLLQQYPHSVSVLTKLHELMTRYYADLKDSTTAAAVLQRIREIKGSDYEASYHNRLGIMHQDTGEYRRAAEEFTLACNADPSVAVYHTNLALACRRLHEWDKARAKLADAFKLDNNQKAHDRELANTLNDQALEHLARNEYRESIELFREATRLAPNDDVLHASTAYVLERMDVPAERLSHLREAIGELETAATLDPKRDDYRRRLADLQVRRTLVQQFGEPGFLTPVSIAITIEVGDALVPLVDSKSDGGTFLFQLIPALRSHFQRATGIAIPGFRMNGNPAIPAGALKIFLDEAPVALVSFPDNAQAAALIDGIKRVLLDHREVFVDLDEIDTMVRRWKSEGLVSEKVDRKLADTEFFVGLSRILRTLARNGVSLSNPEVILSAVEESGLGPSEIPAAIDAIRQRLKETLPGNSPGALVIHLPADLESELAPALDAPHDLPVLLRFELLRRVAALQPAASRSWTLVVSSPILRMLVAQLIQWRLPNVTVLAESELTGAPSLTHGESRA